MEYIKNFDEFKGKENANVENPSVKSFAEDLIKQTPFNKLMLGYVPLTEANLNHIMKNAENNGIIIISANRGNIISNNPNIDLSKDFRNYCINNNIINDDQPKDVQYRILEDKKLQEDWLSKRNKLEYKKLHQMIKQSPYSYSKVFGGFKEDDNTNAVYEQSFIVYCVDRKGNQLPYDKLFEFGKELCKLFKQESFFGQAPGEAPNHYDLNGEIQNTTSSKMVKFNRREEQYFTTSKMKKGDNAQRFTNDIIYECYQKEMGFEYYSLIRRHQWGEYMLL